MRFDGKKINKNYEIKSSMKNKMMEMQIKVGKFSKGFFLEIVKVREKEKDESG